MSESFEQLLEDFESQRLPPVRDWNPLKIRDMDLEIDFDGVWHYRGTPFSRRDVAALLATVLSREGDEYFLMSPTEKLRIRVVDVPFIVTDFEVSGDARAARLILDTSVGLKARVDADHPLSMRVPVGRSEAVPYAVIERGIEARFARGAYYRLIDAGATHDVAGTTCFGVWSAGTFFPLGEVTW